MAADVRQHLGKYGEGVACDALRRRGYEIVERRIRIRGGEIDIVALDRDVVVFVEVKTRAGAAFGGASAAVTLPKQRQLTSLATAYLARRRWMDRPCRFDVVTVEVVDGRLQVCVYPQAFDAC